MAQAMTDYSSLNLNNEIQREYEQMRELKAEIEKLNCQEKQQEEEIEEEERSTPGPPETEEENEWKIRYERQVSTNTNLQQQITNYKDTLSKKKLRLKTLAHGEEIEEFTGSNAKKTLIRLTREKQNLESQMRDYEWRLDQEGSNLQKAEEKRDAFLKDMAKAGARTNGAKTMSKSIPPKNSKLKPTITRSPKSKLSQRPGQSAVKRPNSIFQHQNNMPNVPEDENEPSST